MPISPKSAKIVIFYENDDFRRFSTKIDDFPRKSTIFVENPPKTAFSAIFDENCVFVENTRSLRSLVQRAGACAALDGPCACTRTLPRTSCARPRIFGETWTVSPKMAIFCENRENRRFSTKIVDFPSFSSKMTIFDENLRFSSKILARYARSRSAPRACTALDGPCMPAARCLGRATRGLAFSAKSGRFCRKRRFSTKIAIFAENLRFSTKIRENLRFSRFSLKTMFSAKMLARCARSRSTPQAHTALDEPHAPVACCLGRVTHALAFSAKSGRFCRKRRFSTKIAIFT